MSIGRIDVHSHLLPGVDDGSDSIEESIACARELVEAGYTHSFCTPHVWVGRPDQTFEMVRQWTGALQQRLADAGVPLTLMPGGEINLYPGLIDTLGPERVATYNALGKYCLVDMWADKLPDFFEPTIRFFQAKGLTVILAHPERMRAVQDEPGLADRFAKMGILLQGNLQCLDDKPHAHTRKVAEKYLTEGRYFLLGSDLHKLNTLPTRLAGLRNAIELVGEDVVNRLTIENPRKLFQ
ncbi:MAG TPA: CpsB/CapC family capsule biosynthesis tyrosine phosphatase [Tepidisphaeraceae bacterium]|nr:CpsB/CapC family capsule biosynthesis tyrosine phosphatase [Tepidisphaeraceae bacterium]